MDTSEGHGGSKKKILSTYKNINSKGNNYLKWICSAGERFVVCVGAKVKGTVRLDFCMEDGCSQRVHALYLTMLSKCML